MSSVYYFSRVNSPRQKLANYSPKEGYAPKVNLANANKNERRAWAHASAKESQLVQKFVLQVDL